MDMKWEELAATKRTKKSIIEKLEQTEGPVFLWGAGAYARAILRNLRLLNINISGIFVNKDTRVSRLGDYQVEQLEDVLGKYSKIDVIIGHAKYEKGVRYLKQHKQVRNVYCFSSVSYGRYDLIKNDYYVCWKEELGIISRRISDQMSIDCLRTYFLSRMLDESDMIFPYVYEDKNYFEHDILQLSREECYLDIGACVGESIKKFIEFVSGEYKHIIGLEPEHDNYLSILELIKKDYIINTSVFPYGAWNEDGQVYFDGSKEVGSIINPKEHSKENIDRHTIEVVSIDSLFDKNTDLPDVSLIKMNYAYGLVETIEGMRNLLRRNKPKIIIRIGYLEENIPIVCAKISEIRNDYHFYFRYTEQIPQALTLFAL